MRLCETSYSAILYGNPASHEVSYSIASQLVGYTKENNNQGRIQHFEKRGAQNCFMNSFPSCGILMEEFLCYCRFRSFLIRNFFVFDIFNACVLYPSKNSYDNLSKKWGASDAHPPKSASDSHLGWYIPLDTTLQATTLVISNKNYQQPKHKHNHEKLRTVSWKRGETETEPNICQVRLFAHNPF